MKVVFAHGHMFNAHAWSRAKELLKEAGIDLRIFSQQQSGREAVHYLETEAVDLFVGQLFHDLPWHAELLESAENEGMRMGLGWDMPPSFSTFSADQCAQFARYMEGISAENYAGGIRYLAACGGMDLAVESPRPVRTHGVYHPDAPELFSDTEVYETWRSAQFGEAGGRARIGIVCYYGQIVEKNHDDIDAVIRAVQDRDMIPLCIASEGAGDAALPVDRRYPWLRYLQNRENLAAVVNLMAGRLLSRPGDAGILKELNVPVFQMIRLYHQSPDEWAADTVGGGGFAGVYGLAQPEMAGAIEPSMAAGAVGEVLPETGWSTRRYAPVYERIEHFCDRLARWVHLRRLSNDQKRVTIVLHNNPCKGVEATLGLAAGLDTFESLARLLSAMKEAGYDTGDAPLRGKDLSDLFMERKAFSEFRWTTVDEIVRKGGVLHRVGREEYDAFFDRLPEAPRQRILDDWGDFPGEGMVVEDGGEPELLVTGLAFGNIRLMAQPKRGCYGAKCNGEVCRILHDPQLSPPHQWLAVYDYVGRTSDAVIHFGTHGALEFLPGKPMALSEGCFPEISIGLLPNIYVYVMDVPGDGIVAKRRGRAVMVDHLTPVYRPAAMNEGLSELETLLGEYLSAAGNGESRRRTLVKEKMIPLMKSLHFVDDAWTEESFEEEAGLIARRLRQIRRTLSPSGMHVLGTRPAPEDVAAMLATVLMKPSEGRPGLEALSDVQDDGGADTFDNAARTIRRILDGESIDAPGFRAGGEFAGFSEWCKDIAGKIEISTREIPQLLRALDGAYIEPGLSGSLSLGKTGTLPTGRNFFTTDVEGLPTTAAWDVGRELADNLLRKYLEEEKRFPESVGVSLWSIDAFKSDGEVFCQILHLMGMRPVWGAAGRVSKIEVVPLEDLSVTANGRIYSPRPRIDVVIQTSGILRDMVPHFADLVDEAAVLAAGLSEPHEFNYICKHTDERLAELKAELGQSLSESEMTRMATFRVFSSPAGTYGVGVGLALDASAWEDEADLAETYINWGGYAYGSDRAGGFSRVAGQKAHQLYAAGLKTLDVSYMRQYSPEYDLVDCGGYAGYLGGMAVAAKTVGGRPAKVYWADANAVGDLSVRDVKDDIETSVTARLLNRKWIESQKFHGYKGAGGVSGRVNNLFKWSATTGKVDKWVFDKVVETYIRDRDNLEWLRTENPYALEEMTRRLLEAESRGLWQADPDMLEAVREAALSVEGDMEEIMGEVTGEFQGGKVDVLTSADVEKWRPDWRIDRPERKPV